VLCARHTKSTTSVAPADAPVDYHYFSKIKDAALVDPRVSLSWSTTTGTSSTITVVVTCGAPSPFVYLDLGHLHGRWTDSGFTCIPSEPRTVSYVRAPGEDALTLDDVKRHVVVRTPWRAFGSKQ
jgi:hypothetical protein